MPSLITFGSSSILSFGGTSTIAAQAGIAITNVSYSTTGDFVIDWVAPDMAYNVTIIGYGATTNFTVASTSSPLIIPATGLTADDWYHFTISATLPSLVTAYAGVTPNPATIPTIYGISVDSVINSGAEKLTVVVSYSPTSISLPYNVHLIRTATGIELSKQFAWFDLTVDVPVPDFALGEDVSVYVTAINPFDGSTLTSSTITTTITIAPPAPPVLVAPPPISSVSVEFIADSNMIVTAPYSATPDINMAPVTYTITQYDSSYTIQHQETGITDLTTPVYFLNNLSQSIVGVIATNSVAATTEVFTDLFYDPQIFNPGDQYGGGVYVGTTYDEVTATYFKLFAMTGDHRGTSLPFYTGTYGTEEILNTGSYRDGKLTCDILLGLPNVAEFPALQWATSQTLGGYTDWYIPSMDDLNLMYRVFKPSTEADYYEPNYRDRSVLGYTGQGFDSMPNGYNYTLNYQSNTQQTSLVDFQVGGPFAYDTTGMLYVASSPIDMIDGVVWTQRFSDGLQYPMPVTNDANYVIPVRRERAGPRVVTPPPQLSNLVISTDAYLWYITISSFDNLVIPVGTPNILVEYKIYVDGNYYNSASYVGYLQVNQNIAAGVASPGQTVQVSVIATNANGVTSEVFSNTITL